MNAWLARYVRGRLAPPRGKPGGLQIGFSPSGLRYSALYASLLQPETGLRIDSVHMRHCPSCNRWLTAGDQGCPRHPDHPIGWRLRQHWMFDAHEETLRERFAQRLMADGTVRLEGVGSDGVVVSSSRLYRCGNRTCDYYLLDPNAPCSVCGTMPPHAARPSSYPPLGPVALDPEPFGMTHGAQAPQPVPGEEDSGLPGLRAGVAGRRHEAGVPALSCLGDAGPARKRRYRHPRYGCKRRGAPMVGRSTSYEIEPRGGGRLGRSPAQPPWLSSGRLQRDRL